jgi:phage gpG-like protein
MRYLKDDKREQRRIERLLKKMRRSPHVAVGILQDERIDDRFSMVDLAAVHEYGSRDGRIPQRSFIRTTCDAQHKKHFKLISALQAKMLDGALNVRQALTRLGEVVSKDMVRTINRGIVPALKPVTIRRKKSSKPLIDTGRLKGSITHEVRDAP